VGADVIPLMTSGVVDMDMSSLSPVEVMKQGLANLANDMAEPAYAARHGNRPVRDFRPARSATVDDSDFFEKSFPSLFPYGEGGFYRHRRTAIRFSEHVRWTLQHADTRFRVHETFPFVVFGILRKKQALSAAKIQIRTQKFQRDSQMLRTLTIDKLRQAQNEEEAQTPVTDPTVNMLKTHVHTTMGHVTGSDQSRYQVRSQIWSTTMCKGPPGLWMTINPSDLHDPIVQVFAGEGIDLDQFVKAMGPDSHRRAQNIAKDPFAVSEFFHFTVKTILETLFQIETTQFKIKRKKGVLGEVDAYLGMKEVQGRGTIHLHILIWLKHTPSPDQLTDMLRSEEFRDKIKRYMALNIRAYLPGMENAESIKKIPTARDVSYARPPHPSTESYDDEVREMETKLACAEQIHTCKLRRCLIQDKTGLYKCKRRAPFECSAEDYVLESGACGPKRLYPYVNAWNPAVLVNARCNNDVKFLTNGNDTKNISYYITMYATKKQGQSYNTSALMADTFAYHIQHPNPSYADDIRLDQLSLLYRLSHSINCRQELAAPLVMTYLMGRSESVKSHEYTSIYWSTFVAHLLSQKADFVSLARDDSDMDGRRMENTVLDE
jgi:hypothetical protein